MKEKERPQKLSLDLKDIQVPSSDAEERAVASALRKEAVYTAVEALWMLISLWG